MTPTDGSLSARRVLSYLAVSWITRLLAVHIRPPHHTVRPAIEVWGFGHTPAAAGAGPKCVIHLPFHTRIVSAHILSLSLSLTKNVVLCVCFAT